jgi:hypothetical protein
MRLVKLLVIILLFCASDASSQVSLPKYYYFDTPADTVGWSHYSLLGADDWEWGDPTGVYLNSVYSSPFLWCTNLQGFFTANSVMVLETPSFDFSDTTDYAISFQHAYNTQSNHGGNIEYSVSGGPWILLGGSLSDKHNWYNVSNVSILSQPAWSGNNYLSFKYSAHKLNFLTGNSDVRFRFKFGGSTNPRDGWSIDNLRIVEDVTDVIANVGDSIIASKYSPNFVVNSQAGYSAIVPVTFNNVTKYYFSTDLVYDTSDIYLGSKSALFNATVNNWTQTFSMVPGLNVGTYYILYQHDADSLVTEPSEINNWSYAVLKIDSTYGLPRQFDFSDGFQGWKREGPVLWEIGPGISHHAEGVHSDSNAVNIYKGNNTTCYIESPFFDLTSANNPIMSFWMNSSSTGYVKYSVNNGLNWPTLATFGASPQDDWFNFSVNLDSTYQNIKFRIYGETVVIDDIYLGTSFPDLSIEKDKFNRFTSTQQATYTLNYSFFNSGLVYAISTETEFYWSNDSILDSGDIFLGSNTDPAINSNTVVNGSFTVNKPILTPGKYYIFYKIDGQNSIVENREYDNTGFFILYQNDAITAPYINDFETQIDGWRHGSTLGGDDWEWGVPQGIFLDTAFSGTKAIITNADGWVTPMSRMHFYTPIFDFTSWLNPVIEFDMKNYCLGGLVQWNHLSSNMSYSIDGGANWVNEDDSFERILLLLEFP